LRFAFAQQGRRVETCLDCGFHLVNPQPAEAEPEVIPAADDFASASGGDGGPVAGAKQATALAYLKDVARYGGRGEGRLLVVGGGAGDFLAAAGQLGYHATAVELSAAAAHVARRKAPAAAIHCGPLASAPLEARGFDVCVLCDVLEHVGNPVELVRAASRLLKPDGVLFLTIGSLASGAAPHGKGAAPLSYFSHQTIQNLLYAAGFRDVLVRPGQTAPQGGSLVRAAASVARRLRRRPPPDAGLAVLARASAAVGRPKLSVIVPAYNEVNTFDSLMSLLVRKQLPGMDMEIIIVESNSSDGTRDLVRRYEAHPRVKLLLQDAPRGKGNAVRAGLAHATGDFVLIQDADLEYDLDDYEALLEPLLRGQASFVLGARHGGKTYKIRKLETQPIRGGLLNFGHWFFAFLVNVLFGLSLKDPFTMFKVFRRDCLAGLTFQCNRFDFDYELLIKLVRKGYRPLEIPANYRSRSFHEGKKVSMLRDPLTWIRVLARLRLARIDPLEEIGRGAGEAARRPAVHETKEAA
jgi:SAM-dependent methyltransferase